MNSYYKIFMVVILIGGACVAGAYLYIQQNQQKDAAAVQAMKGDLLNGRNTGAIQKAQALLASKKSLDPLYSTSISTLATASFEELNNQEDKVSSEEWIKIINLSKKQFESAPDPYAQANAVNMMATVLRSSRYDSIVAAEIFKDAPFKALYGENLTISLNELATYSIESFPTASAYMMRARVQADLINSLLKPGSIVPINAADRPDLIAKATHIEEDIKTAKTIEVSTTSPYDSFVDHRNTVSAGYALSQAARVDQKYWPQAESMFKEVIHYAETTVDENGDSYPTLLRLSATARLRYARALYEVFGDARASDITTQLNTLSAMVERQPELYAVQDKMFGAMFRNRTSFEPAARNYQEYAGLAKYSSAFASYLKSRGWDL